MSAEVRVVRTGAANLASVSAALRRLGATPVLTESADAVRTAERLVLPGVGAFGAALARLGELGLVEPLRARIAAGRPTLAVCLGLQLLAEGSAESRGVSGLSAFPGQVTRFVHDEEHGVREDGAGAASELRVPQLGWNFVAAANESAYLTPGYAYFANSYKLDAAPAGWTAAMSTYGRPFVAALERGAVLACQFHPELSGAWGLAVLRRWLEHSGAADAEAAAPPAPASPPPGHSAPVRIIPCLDTRDGRVVKGVRFQGLRDAGAPAALARAYEEQGADELVVLDVSATPDGRAHQVETIRSVRAELSIPLTAGGGVRRLADAGALLDAGADKVAVNTAAVRTPELLAALAAQFGRQCTVLALDAARAAAGGWEVVVTSGRERTGRDALAWAREAVERGAGEILLTSWDRDGTRMGYDLELLTAIARVVPVPVVASGGAAHPWHLAAALRAGASAVLAASIFHDGELTVRDVKRALAADGVEVRL
jgi:imidazole glycerol-phosphate synthase subunit HisF